jgi:SAM-dependent methyltransferase
MNPIPQPEQDILFPIVGKTMLELGNKKTNGVSYKSWLVSHYGIDHTSVDLNGLDGALVLDLRKPLNFGLFDVVTNFGTSEHVSEQEPVWRNIHEACAVGGVMCGATPHPGDWHWHGDWYPTMDFYEQLAELNAYRVEILMVAQDKPVRNIYYRMIKQHDGDFVMPPTETIYHNKIRPK